MLKCLFCWLPFFCLSLGAPAMLLSAEQPPNIILLLADDLGYADLGCFGSSAARTPHIDKLAAEGTTFTQFYAASAVCTPSRASVLSGRYPLRFDIRKHFPDDESHLPRGTVTIPQLLKQAGYQTAHVGKWHLGGLHLKHIRDRKHSIPGPHQHGFDDYLCQNEEQPLRGKLGRARRLFRDGGTCLIRNEKQVDANDPYYHKHFTDINGDETTALIEKFHKQKKPFFLNVWWLVPHKPYEPAPQPHWSQTAKKNISDDQHRFRSMVEHMDAKVGQIIKKLDELGIRENTLILFTSDNGAAYEGHIGDLKGGKTDLHEGGIRVPMIINWKGHIPVGKKTNTLGHTNDLLPTFCAAAGVKLPANVKFDGLNLLPHITEKHPISEKERGTIFWQIDLYRHLQRHYPKPKPYATEIVRRGNWKLLCKEGKGVELFNIKSDRQEKKNLLGQHPEIEKQLTAELQQFLKEPRQRWKEKK
ncbi:Arylsulfatase [hydrothermal vent metagenome]|uniref:Arylsulfatase n=1 Tax=hydrothermal vent metagenome TaxID=652676 RepID=A0A3B1DNK4_9ZZZZ